MHATDYNHRPFRSNGKILQKSVGCFQKSDWKRRFFDQNFFESRKRSRFDIFRQKNQNGDEEKKFEIIYFLFSKHFLVSRQEYSVVDRGVASQFFFAAFLMNKPLRLMTDLSAFYFPTFKTIYMADFATRRRTKKAPVKVYLHDRFQRPTLH